MRKTIEDEFELDEDGAELFSLTRWLTLHYPKVIKEYESDKSKGLTVIFT